jgi:hypothetical protein
VRQGRSAKFEEVGDVAVLITSPRMSLVNGVNLSVDGECSFREERRWNGNANGVHDRGFTVNESFPLTPRCLDAYR